MKIRSEGGNLVDTSVIPWMRTICWLPGRMEETNPYVGFTRDTVGRWKHLANHATSSTHRVAIYAPQIASFEVWKIPLD